MELSDSFQFGWFVAGWVATAFFVIAGLNQVMNLVDRFRDKPSASERHESWRTEFDAWKEREAKEAAERRRLIYSRIEELRREVQADHVEMKKDLKADFDGVHNRITEILTGLSELKGRVNAKEGGRHD